MKTKEEKEELAIRKQLGYKRFMATLNWLGSPEATPKAIFDLIHPEAKTLWSQRKARRLVIKDYKDAKRQTEGATGRLGNPVPVL